jgi:hypothetical protein
VVVRVRQGVARRIAHFWTTLIEKCDVVAPGHAGRPRRVEGVAAAPPLQFGVVVNGERIDPARFGRSYLERTPRRAMAVLSICPSTGGRPSRRPAHVRGMMTSNAALGDLVRELRATARVFTTVDGTLDVVLNPGR